MMNYSVYSALVVTPETLDTVVTIALCILNISILVTVEVCFK